MKASIIQNVARINVNTLRNAAHSKATVSPGSEMADISISYFNKPNK